MHLNRAHRIRVRASNPRTARKDERGAWVATVAVERQRFGELPVLAPSRRVQPTSETRVASNSRVAIALMRNAPIFKVHTAEQLMKHLVRKRVTATGQRHVDVLRHLARVAHVDRPVSAWVRLRDRGR